MRRKVRDSADGDTHKASQSGVSEHDRTIQGTIREGRLVPVTRPNTAGTVPDLDGHLWAALGESLASGRLAEARTLWQLLDARAREQAAGDTGRKVG